MPRRVPAPATQGRASSTVSFADIPPPSIPHSDNLAVLRRQWKWAAFSQFFYTFAPLLAAPDIALTDIEDDLARGTALYLPRIMHRLLYTLTQDRKLSLENWQSALRRQYLRRDPDANPLGPEPSAPSRVQSRDPATPVGEVEDQGGASSQPEQGVKTISSSPPANGHNDLAPTVNALIASATNDDRETGDNSTAHVPRDGQDDHDGKSDPDVTESRDWLEMTMLEKLESLHLLTEWQFQNPHRLRTIMKDDGDHGQWRIEPIGYDSKLNAYWLIGPDRLWLQRKPPRPPALKRKRKAPGTKPAKKAPAVDTIVAEPESEPEATPRKRTRRSGGHTLEQHASLSAGASSGRGTRAAKLQANKKLDAQAKELAEFQRQAARAAVSEKASPRTSRNTRSNGGIPEKSGRKPPLGVRTSARLRGDSLEDDEWQQIPEDWLQETVDTPATRRTRTTRSSRARGKQPPQPPSDDEDAEFGETVPDALHTGLSSDDAVSELTELSDTESTTDAVVKAEDAAVPLSSAEGNVTEHRQKADEVEGPPETLTADTSNHIPADFIEWEAIAVTLPEWEAIGERFAKATHYLEKALHKVLSQHIVPAVTADLREAERKRKIEEAIVHRKRSSRIASKESEKEQARLAALKKAEEEEKLARAKRSEARAMKEQAEREKRELAREQRRLEREERERRAQGRRESASAVTPSASVVSSSSIQPTRNVTPNGVRTPDWTLDCEICGRCGVNMDDGLPMVSCGMCSRWQHITCHDTADRTAGLPRRNWEVQQFYCKRCKPVAMQRLANGSSRGSTTEPTATSHPRAQKTYPQVQQYGAYAPAAPDTHYPSQASYTSGVYGQHYPQDQYGQSSAAVYARSQRPQNSITFSHYQPQQHGFSRAPWSNGYSLDGHGAQQVNSYNPNYQQNGSYPTAHSYQYTNQSVHAQGYSPAQAQELPQRMPDSGSSLHSTGWVASDGHRGSSGHISASHYGAAESLAHLQSSGPPTWPNGSYPQPAPPGISSTAANVPSALGRGTYNFSPS